MVNRRTIWRMMLVLVLALGIVGVAFAQQSVAIDTLPILASGDAIRDFFDSDVNTHLYAFHASAGDVVTVGMTQATDELDPFLVLLDASGAVLAVDDDSGATFLSAEITGFEIPEDNTYLVLATSLQFLEGSDDTMDNLDYTLSVTGNTMPDGFDSDTVELVVTPLNYGVQVQGESSDDAQVALFAFEGAAGDVVDVWVDSQEFPTVLYVFDPQGARLAVDPSAITGLALPEDGTYLILATDVFFYEAMQTDTFYVGGAFTLALNGS